MNVMEIVVLYDIPALRPVPANVEGADIAGFLRDIMDLVEFQEVLITAEAYSYVGSVVDIVMGQTVAHARQADRRLVGAINPAVMMNVVVLGEVMPFHECCTVAPGDTDPTLDIVDITAQHAVRCAAGDGESCAEQITGGTPCDEVVCSAGHHNAMVAGRLNRNAADGDIRSAGELNDGNGEC